jgi:hypothetical protein
MAVSLRPMNRDEFARWLPSIEGRKHESRSVMRAKRHYAQANESERGCRRHHRSDCHAIRLDRSRVRAVTRAQARPRLAGALPNKVSALRRRGQHGGTMGSPMKGVVRPPE